MKLIFTSQYANIFLLVNGLAILLYIGARKKKRQRAMKFGNYETLQKVAGKKFLKSSNLMLLIRLAALTVLIIGISNPVIVEEISASNSDYVIAIDSSSSMLTTDIDPTRFRASKSVSRRFVSELRDKSKVGVVSFSGRVEKNQDLTRNKELVRQKIKDVETGEKAGTAIGDALFTSVSMLLGNNRSRTIILITDGRNNVGGSVNDSVNFAVRNNVTIHSIGIGSERDTDNFDVVDGVNASRAVYPNINQRKLSDIANETGGKYVTATNKTELKSAILNLEESEIENDISRYFVLLALLILLVEWVLGSTRYSILP